MFRLRYSVVWILIALSTVRETAPQVKNRYPVNTEDSLFHVSLRIKSVDNSDFGAGHYCSGALIGWNTVVSAAHCLLLTKYGTTRFLRPTEMMAVMGTLNRLKKSPTTITRDVREYKFDRSYDEKSVIGDISIVYLHGYIPDNNPAAKPIQVTYEQAEPGLDCSITGWGKAKDPPGESKMEGLPATLDETKHQVSLRIKKTDDEEYGSGHYCSGSLVTWNTVVTAAYCLMTTRQNIPRFLHASEIRVIVGDLQRVTKTTGTAYDVKAYSYDKIYNGKDVLGDIGILFLNGLVKSQEGLIKPIPLPEMKLDSEQDIGVGCRMSGWSTSTQDTNPSDVLLIADVSVIDKNICRKKMPYITSSLEDQICIKWSQISGVCTADSGAPMVCGGVLVGIFSWTAQTCETEQPNLLTDVYFYRNWILYGTDIRGRSLNCANSPILNKSILLILMLFWLNLLSNLKSKMCK